MNIVSVDNLCDNECFVHLLFCVLTLVVVVGRKAADVVELRKAVDEVVVLRMNVVVEAEPRTADSLVEVEHQTKVLVDVVVRLVLYPFQS